MVVLIDAVLKQELEWDWTGNGLNFVFSMAFVNSFYHLALSTT